MLRIRLRTLFGLIAVVAVFSSLCALKLRRFEDMTRLSCKIESNGGSVDWVLMPDFHFVGDEEHRFLYPLAVADSRTWLSNIVKVRFLNLDLKQETINNCRKDLNDSASLIMSIRCDACDISEIQFASTLRFAKISADSTAQLRNFLNTLKNSKLEYLEIEAESLDEDWVGLLSHYTTLRALALRVDSSSSGDFLTGQLFQLSALSDLQLENIVLEKREFSTLCQSLPLHRISIGRAGFSSEEISELENQFQFKIAEVSIR